MGCLSRGMHPYVVAAQVILQHKKVKDPRIEKIDGVLTFAVASSGRMVMTDKD